MDIAAELLGTLILGWFFGSWLGPHVGMPVPYDALCGALLGFSLSMMSLYRRAINASKRKPKSNDDNKKP